MAERGRTVLVTGLPSQIQTERLEDKLCIHFQRRRNGGGDVESVSAVKTSSEFALVTFEDSRVAQRVIQQNQHILEVDEKHFNLTVKEHPAGPSADKIILNLSATVDYSQLSAAQKKTLKAFNKNHPDVQIDRNLPAGLCNLNGSYSMVQTALAQLLGQDEHPQMTQNKELKTSVENKPNHSSSLLLTQVSHDQTKTQKERQERPLVEKHTSRSQRDITPGGYEWEGKGAAASPPDFDEDFSLMLDADLYQYLQKYCGDEYHQILKRHGVAVVDYTHQGLTTLLLQVTSADVEWEQEYLCKAKEDITRLYQANQTKVCRDNLSKAIIPNTAMEQLGSKFTKLLISEDKDNIYLIGSRVDVGEAKSFLLLHDHSEGDRADATSPRRFQDSWPSNEVKTPVSSPGILESNGLETFEDDSKLDSSPKIKLAAQFQKESRLAPIGSKSSNFTVKANSQSKSKSRQGPMLGLDVLSDSKGSVSLNAQSTSGNAMMDTRPKTITTPGQPDSLATPSSPNTSGSSLRRSSSFSGVTQRKEQEISPKSDLEAGKGRVRSSSFDSTSKQEHTAQITVDNVMWTHIKKAYKLRIEELTSEIQITEKRAEKSKNIILLTGTSLAKVKTCQQDLQRLIESVNVDFDFKSISLSSLGLTDAKYETLVACFMEIYSLYKKISIEIYDKTLYLFGPRELCYQVGQSLIEVFAGANLPDRQQVYNDVSQSAKNNGANGHVSPRKDAVIREKVKLQSSNVEKDGQNAQEPIIKNPSINGSVPSLEDRTKTKRQQTTASTESAVCEACKRVGATVKKMFCGLALCSDCLVKAHSHCRQCSPIERGIQGRMSYVTLPMSIPGYIRDPVVKITYFIPDGIQGEEHPSPGKPFKGGQFEAYLPDCEQTRTLLPRLQRAFRRGHTFTVTTADTVYWDKIPHKTSMQGGKSGNGYPDSTYLHRLSEILKSLGL